MHTILVVDDDVGLAKMLARKLAASDRRVLTAGGSAEAIETLNREQVDVVLSDDHMPGMTGRELLASVRHSHPDTVRILMTGKPSLESALSALNDHEVYRYLTKPLEADEIRKVMEAAIAKLDESKKKKGEQSAVNRRQRLVEELEKVYPGLLTVPPGAYRPRRSKKSGAALDSLLSCLAYRDPARVPSEDLPLDEDPIALTDELLAVPVRHARYSIVIEATPNGHVVMLDPGSRAIRLFGVDGDLGDAMSARIATVAGLDIAASGQQVGRAKIIYDNEEGEVAVALRSSSRGLSVEIRLLADARDDDAADGSWSGGTDGSAYKFLEVIGEGGLGIVYRGVHLALHKPVAIKVLREEVLREPLAAARLLREARAASRAMHKGIVGVLDYGRLPDSRPFLVMELVEAETLEQRIARGPIEPREVIDIAISLATALQAAHEAGVVHRDLKPSNIFVDDDLSVKLSDFGAAKLMDDVGPALTVEGTTVGTPYYMAPEQARGQRIDRRTDIYALGCVVFEMLSGEPPFGGDNALAVITQHVLSAVPQVTSPRGPLPLPLSRTVRRAMAKNPGERHQNCLEFIADLQQAVDALNRKGWRRWLP